MSEVDHLEQWEIKTGLSEAGLPTEAPTVEALRKVVADHKAVILTWPKENGTDEQFVVDIQTANAVVTVFDNISQDREDLRAKVDRMIGAGPVQFGRVVELAWKMMRPVAEPSTTDMRP